MVVVGMGYVGQKQERAGTVGRVPRTGDTGAEEALKTGKMLPVEWHGPFPTATAHSH